MKRYLLLFGLLASCAPSVFGFAFVGPYESWQINDLGFQVSNGANGWLDFGGPKNIGDQFRWNIPVIYYAYDASFLSYFGASGQAAIDQSFAVYNSLGNLSSYPNSLTNFPLDSSRLNQTAYSLSLMDLKSANMSMIAGYLGLGAPTRFTWNEHNRFPIPNTTCLFRYTIVQRNFDPITLSYSDYVNGNLIDYRIAEFCGVTPAVAPLSFAFGYPINSAITHYTAVADQYADAFQVGVFYSGLTRDDVGGLRYLMSTNRLANETPQGGSLQVSTNFGSLQQVTSFDYGLFLQQALTNSGPALQALYPQLQILTNNLVAYTNLITTNVNYFLIQNPPGQPVGTFGLGSNVVFTTNFTPVYTHVYGNLQVINFNPSSVQTTTTISFGQLPGQLVGVRGFITNVTTTTLNQPSGDVIFQPQNACGNYTINVAASPFTFATTTGTTNISPSGVTVPTSGTVTISVQTVTTTTIHTITYYPTECNPNSTQVFEGVDHVQFVRHDYDSLLSASWTPVTNTYNLTAVLPNNYPQTQLYYRVVTTPDLVYEAADNVNGPATLTTLVTYDFNYLKFTGPTSTDGAGPGNMVPGEVFKYGKGGGTMFINSGFFQTQATGLPFFFNWASFDGTTNAPIVYPSSQSLSQLVDLVFFQIQTINVPDYHINAAYSAANPYKFQLTASGRTPPYTWSFATNSAGGLPAGLTLSSSGLITGYGVGATNSGSTFSFSVQAKDTGGFVTQAPLYINIKP